MKGKKGPFWEACRDLISQDVIRKMKNEGAASHTMKEVFQKYPNREKSECNKIRGMQMRGVPSSKTSAKRELKLNRCIE